MFPIMPLTLSPSITRSYFNAERGQGNWPGFYVCTDTQQTQQPQWMTLTACLWNIFPPPHSEVGSSQAPDPMIRASSQQLTLEWTLEASSPKMYSKSNITVLSVSQYLPQIRSFHVILGWLNFNHCFLRYRHSHPLTALVETPCTS